MLESYLETRKIREQEIDEKEIANNYIKKQNLLYNKKFFPFALDILPKSFDIVRQKELKLIKEFVKKKCLAKNKFFKDDLNFTIDCYLKDCNVDVSNVLKFLIIIFEGILFKKKEQIKGLTFDIHDIAKDPCNCGGEPFIGIVLRDVNCLIKKEK